MTTDEAREALLHHRRTPSDAEWPNHIAAFEAAIRAEYAGTTAERVWAALEDDPAFVAAIEQGKADLTAGRFREWRDSEAKLAALPEHVEAWMKVRGIAFQLPVDPNGTFYPNAAAVIRAALDAMEAERWDLALGTRSEQEQGR